MNVLMVDLNKNSRFKDFVPLALLRLARKHERDNVELIKSGQIPKNKPDIIYFSLIFLFNYKNDIEWILPYKRKYPNAKILIGGISVSLKPEIYLKYFSEDELFIGRDLELENLKPNFDIANKNYSYGFTSRSCHNKCEWCVVPVLEGKHCIIENWKTQIDTTKKIFYCFDNNIFSCGYKHLDEVLTYCDSHNIRVDFNQGMDAELFFKNKKIQEVFLKHKNSYQNIRFAWDSHRVDESIKFVFDFIDKNNIHSKDTKLIYMLYDNPDNKPEDVFERIKYILNLKGEWKIKLMRFKNIETGKYDKAWSSIGDLFAKSMSFTQIGLINKGDYFRYMYKDNIQSFIFKMKYYDSYKAIHKVNDTKQFIKYCENKLTN